MFNESVVLSNGVQIPKLGFGTWLIDNDIAAEAVINAVKCGYRHIDTAQAYRNEEGVGLGIKNCGIPREEIFITSKVAAELKSYEEAVKSIDESLRKLGVSYLDMIIIHCPQPWAEYRKSDNHYYEENRQVWKALEEALSAGKLRAIGVSNFSQTDIESLLETANVKPMVNQILCHIANTPFELIDYCKNQGIAVEAYSPIAHGDALKSKKINETAKKYGVSVPQLCIRYCIQLGTIALPKSVHAEYIKANTQIDFVISDEDMEILKKIDLLSD